MPAPGADANTYKEDDLIGAAEGVFGKGAEGVAKMIQNILKTDRHEAGELMSWSMVGAVFLWSVLPVAFVWWVRIEHRPWLRSFFIRTAQMAGALVVAVLAVLLVSRDQGLTICEQVAARLARLLDWNAATTAQMLAEYRAEVALSRQWR